MSRKKNQNIVGAEEFFAQDQLTELDAKVEEYDKPEKSGISKIGIGIISLITVLLLSSFAGLLISIIPLTYVSATMPIIEPVADALKKMPDELEEVDIAERNKMYDINGNVFAEFWTEDRIPLDNVDKISQNAINALVAAEDSRYYEHHGVDIIGTGRAILSTGGGGSGITQQLVKNLQFYNMAGKDKEQATEQTYNRKLRELKLALAYENKYNKDEILLRYFNTVAFGGPNTYSIEAASQYFFGKSSKDLSIAEASALVGTVQNPSMYDFEVPENKELWKERQSYVIDRMIKEEYITKEEGDAAKAEELNFVFKGSSAGNCSSSTYPAYCEYVLDELLSSEKLGETLEERQAILAKGGLQIKTYLNPTVMSAIDNRLKEDFGTWNRVVAPAAVIQPGTGGIEGFGVNRDYGVGEGKTVINVADNPAGTGSTYKPFALAAALNAGMTEQDLKFASSGCPLYPAGYDAPPNGYGNSVSCAFQGGFLDSQQATAWSSNTWYVTLAEKIGLDKVAEMSKTLGLNVPDSVLPRGMSFVLGTVENSTIDMAAAYATFANDGIFCPAKSIVSYEYANGSSPAVPETYLPESDSCKRAMSPYAASVVLKSLRANTVPGYVDGAFGLKGYIPGRDAVGKTGTNEHTNFAWGQVAKQHALFINIYDMDEVSRGAEYIWYRGYEQYNMVQADAGSRVLADVFAATGEPNIPLNYGATDMTITPVPIEKKEFFTVPSVLGMSPAEAVGVMESLDITVHVSKDKKTASSGYQSGVIVEQNIEAGTQLPIGTKKEIILFESK